MTCAFARTVGASAHVTGVAPWSARVFRIRPRFGQTARAIGVEYWGLDGLKDAIVQILRIGSDGSLLEVHRYDEATVRKLIHFEGLDSVLVIIGARDSAGSFTLAFEEHAELSDVMVTPANAIAGSEMAVDPRAWSWTWMSPDVMVDNDDDGRADELLPFGQDNKLKVRLRNRGNIRSGPILVRFWYQPAVPTPAEDAWMPVVDSAGVHQELSGVRLDPDEFRWYTVDWTPADDGSGTMGFLVRVELAERHRSNDLRVPENDDNKSVTTTIMRVRPLNDPDFIDVRVRIVNGGAVCGVCPVPHGPDWSAEEEEGSESEPAFGIGTRRFRLTRRGQRVPFPMGTKELAPTGRHYYPVDPRTLPPGVASEDLVTIVAHSEGEALSGMSFEVAAVPTDGTDSKARAADHTAEGSGPTTLLS